MIATLLGAVCLTESTGNESMLWGVATNESVSLVTSVFAIHPFI